MRFPTDASTIYEMRRAGKYHSLDCGVWRRGWCDCGGFLTDADERAWCEVEAQRNRAVPVNISDDLNSDRDRGVRARAR